MKLVNVVKYVQLNVVNVMEELEQIVLNVAMVIILSLKIPKNAKLLAQKVTIKMQQQNCPSCENCLTCLSLNDCTACESPLYLYDGECLEKCPSYHFPIDR